MTTPYPNSPYPPAGYGHGAAYPNPQGGYPGGGYPPQGPAAFGLAMKRRNPVGAWLGLPIITFGIYSLVWYYKINKEMAQFDSRRQINPGTALLAITLGMFLIVPPFVSLYKTGSRIADAQRAAGLNPSCSGGLGLLLGFFGFGTLYYQIELNKVADRYQQAPPGTQVQLAV
ncbi:DUF4234 domain-containing protein [Streptomyces sp. NPDC046215]|uniref:DUF4234 domain-containing protein n=1 Tax=Streptomyces stramineus TaxID=173861 RepID=A0ABN0ZX71_9ACTN